MEVLTPQTPHPSTTVSSTLFTSNLPWTSSTHPFKHTPHWRKNGTRKKSDLLKQHQVLQQKLQTVHTTTEQLTLSNQELHHTLQQERNSFEQQQQTCSDEIMRLQSDNASYQSQLQNAQGVSENRQCTIRQMNQDMETLRTTNEDLQTQLQTTRAILASTKQELSMLRTNHDYNKLETRCNQLKEQTRLQSQDLRTTRESLTAAQSKYSQACETITTLQTQLSNLREYSRLSDRPCQWSNKVFVFGSIDRPEVNGYYKLQPSFSTIVFKNNFNYSIREGPSNWYLLHESLYKGCPMYICPKREHHTRAAQSSSHRRSSCTIFQSTSEFGWRVNPDILSHTRTINNIMIFNMDSQLFAAVKSHT